jgi:hypothetical protein
MDFRRSKTHAHTDQRVENVVSRLRPRRRSSRRLSRITWRVLWIAIGIAAGGAIVTPHRPTRGVFLILLVSMTIGTAVAWLVGRGGLLSESDREMGDDWQNQWNAPPPP